MALKIIEGDAREHSGSADILFTDPPFDMTGKALASILARYRSEHLVLITSMRQLLEFVAATDWQLAFDFVLDAVQPKESKAVHQPHYTHQTGVYLRKPGARSIFDRKRRARSDLFEDNGYWPTVIRAPRERGGVHGQAKSVQAVTDILGSFRADSVIDPFAGSFTTLLAAADIGIDAVGIERVPSLCAQARKSLRFLGLNDRQ